MITIKTIRTKMAMYSISLLMLISTPLQADDLVEVFKLALENDPEWSAQVRKFQGNEETLTIGRAGLLPVIIAQIRAARTDTNLSGGGNPEDCNAIGLFRSLTDDLEGLTGTDTSGQLAAVINLLQNGESNSAADAERVLNACFQPTESTTTTFSVNLTQPMFRLDRFYDYRLAKTEFNRGQIEFNQARQDLILRTAENYFNYLRAKEEFEFTNSETKAIKYQLESSKQRYRKGLTNRLNVFETQAIYDLSQAAYIASQAAYDSAYEDLVSLTNLPDLKIAPLPNNILIENPSPSSVAKWVEFTQRFNPEIQLGEVALMSAKQNFQRKRAAHSPTIDLVASHSRQDSGNAAVVNIGDTTTNSIGVAMNIPIYAGGRVSSARKQAKQKEFELSDILTKVYTDSSNSTRKLFRKVQSDVLAVRAQQVAIVSNKAALSAITQGYEKGSRTAAEVLKAQRDLFQARKQYTNAKYDYVLDTLRLKRTTGTITEADLSVLNSWLLDTSAIVDTRDPEPVLFDDTPITRESRTKRSNSVPVPRTNARDFETVPKTRPGTTSESNAEQQPRRAKSLFEALRNL